MKSSQFIFSDAYRLKRHLLFWLCWSIFCSVLYAFHPGPVNLGYDKRLIISALDALLYLVPHMFLSYSLMYLVVPKLLLKSRYVITALAVVLLFLCTAGISAVIGVYILPDLHKLFFPETVIAAYRPPARASFFLALLAGLRGAITIGGIAAAIKLTKHWYIKEQRNMQLQKENIQSQLQLLKAQVHPHFLFNTLNNIYAYTQNTSSIASRLVMGLSDMLRYMLYECNQPLVPLSKELKMLQDYIMLEKIRYGNRLEVNIDLPDGLEEFEIAPLLLLPFVENTFKHGASQMLDQPWLSLRVTVDGQHIHMKLVNGKAENYKAPTNEAGIGIQNVQQRLELLYPNKYSLKIQDEEEVFIVDLKLELERRTQTTTSVVTPEKAVAYE